MIHSWEIGLRLFLAALAGGIVGLERERKGHPAGIRTHMLLTMGAALIMLISVDGFDRYGTGDPARLAAQVVSGIGFLCGGTILRTGGNVHGLTTAASLWVCGGIGLAVGIGYYFGAVMMTLLVVITLALLALVQKKIFFKFQMILYVHAQSPQSIADLAHLFRELHVELKDMAIEMPDGHERKLTYYLTVDRNFNRNNLIERVSQLEGILSTSWEDI